MSNPYDTYRREDGEPLHGAAAMTARLKDQGGITKRDHDNYLAGYRQGYQDRDSEVAEELSLMRQQMRGLAAAVARLGRQTSDAG